MAATIQDALIAWGKSRPINDPPNGYPRAAAFARLISRGNVPVPPMTDEEHDRVDAEVSRLKSHNAEYYKVIFGSYVFHWSDARIGRQFRVSRNTIRTTRIAAEAYLAGRLNY